MTRVPPHSIEAEQAVLGALLSHPSCVADVVDALPSTAFYRTAHRKIYEAVKAVNAEGAQADAITVSDHLKAHKLLDECGGFIYLTELMESAFTSENVGSYVKVINDKAVRRAIIAESSEIQDMAHGAGLTEDILERAGKLSLLESVSRHDESFRDAMLRYFEEVDEMRDRGMAHVRSSIHELNNKTHGFQNSDLIIIAGRPSHGKTAFMTDVIVQTAIKGRIPVGVCELEMKTTQLVNRILSRVAEVNSFNARNGNLSAAEYARISETIPQIETAPIHIDDTSGVKVQDIRARARSWKQRFGIGLLCVDYLQIMGTNASETRNHAIGEITRSFKGLAKELDIPVILLSQLSRRCEMEKRAPRLDDLRDSGEIEQDADVVLFVHRPELFGKTDMAGQVELILAKQRNGPIGTVRCTFSEQYAGFGN